MIYSFLMTAKLWGLNARTWLSAYLQACADNGSRGPSEIDARARRLFATSRHGKSDVAFVERVHPALPLHWEQCYGYRPVLLEPFVESQRHRGTCCRAANWIRIGQTACRGKKCPTHRQVIPIKDIWLYPLRKDFATILPQQAHRTGLPNLCQKREPRLFIQLFSMTARVTDCFPACAGLTVLPGRWCLLRTSASHQPSFRASVS